MRFDEKLYTYSCKPCSRTVRLNATELERCKPWMGPYCSKCGKRLKKMKGESHGDN